MGWRGAGSDNGVQAFPGLTPAATVLKGGDKKGAGATYSGPSDLLGDYLSMGSTWFAALVAFGALTVILIVLLYQKMDQTGRTWEQGQSRMSDMRFLGISWLLASVVIIATCTGIECQT